MKEKKALRILQIVPNMQAGGLESFIMNIYRNIDREKIQFDFLVHYDETKHFDNEIEELGGKIYRFNLRNDNNIFKYIVQLNKFYKKHKEYSVIHCHMSSIGFINFLIAKKNGINVRIAHSHNSATDRTVKGLIKRLMILPYKYVSTINYACSNEAGKFLYGKRNFEFIPNSIDVEKYKFSNEKRSSIRKKYNINSNSIVIGSVGRFNIQKNHKFIVKVFNNYHKKNPNSYLILIGDGELRKDIEKMVDEYKISENVIFTGVVSNVYDYYSAMDYFLLPSLFEGLPLVGIEAQASGANVLATDNITRQVEVTDNIYYLPIDNEKNWVDMIFNVNIKNESERLMANTKVLNTNFNINYLAKYFEKKYEEVFSKNERTSKD